MPQGDEEAGEVEEALKESKDPVVADLLLRLLDHCPR
jgi:hypothetical protein